MVGTRTTIGISISSRKTCQLLPSAFKQSTMQLRHTRLTQFHQLRGFALRKVFRIEEPVNLLHRKRK